MFISICTVRKHFRIYLNIFLRNHLTDLQIGRYPFIIHLGVSIPCPLGNGIPHSIIRYFLWKNCFEVCTCHTAIIVRGWISMLTRNHFGRL
uniref:Uncharacterized protein n=1 Tax=Arundo donax TaxID=35708 RepID=A0A0A9BQ13_ARUDO